MSDWFDESDVEKAARAICDAEGFDWNAQASHLTSASDGDDEREHYLHIARGVLSAVKPKTGVASEAPLNKHVIFWLTDGSPVIGFRYADEYYYFVEYWGGERPKLYSLLPPAPTEE